MVLFPVETLDNQHYNMSSSLSGFEIVFAIGCYNIVSGAVMHLPTKYLH